MSNEWTDAKKWPDGERVTGMLGALAKLKAGPGEGLAEALPELLAVLKVQRQGIADVYGAIYKINRYNEATHDQFAQQIEVVRTLVTAVKEQDKIIRRLSKRVDALEKKLAKKTAAPRNLKKTGWFR